MITNQLAKPGEDTVLLLGYRNKEAHARPVSGSVMLLYNEKQFAQNSFDLAEARMYHEERALGSTPCWPMRRQKNGARLKKAAAQGVCSWRVASKRLLPMPGHRCGNY